FHPSDELRKILGLVGKTYEKSKHEIEMLTSRVDLNDVEMGINNERCGSFKGFLGEIDSYFTAS
ncbi:MAG TPA: hypothetical protein PKM08_03790, partial [Syntrophorhabdaceae bacterium]|nr:hypothetical protein [Syntrophorhabdaceae bacterium]